MDKEKIVPAFAPFFKEHGYKKWGTNKFFGIENNIAFCFLFERPSVIVYPTYFIWPLYMPANGVVCLNYGNRLNARYNLCSDDAAFEPWVKRITTCLETEIFPFYESISSPEKLWQLIGQYEFASPRCFWCSPQKFQELQMYTACFLGDVANARKYMELLRDNMATHQYPGYIKKSLCKWEEMINSPQEVREEFFHDTIRNNKETLWHFRS